LLLLGLFCQPSCAKQDATQIVLAVSTDFNIPGSIDKLTIEVSNGPTIHHSSSYSLIPGESGSLKLPATLAFSASESNTTQLLFKVWALKGTDVLVSRQARLRFVKGRKLLLRLELSRRCVAENLGCINKGQTCHPDQGCISLDVDSNTLPDYDETLAYQGVEAGVADSQIDALSDALSDGIADCDGPCDMGIGDQGPADIPLADLEKDAPPDLPPVDQGTTDTKVDLVSFDSKVDLVSIDATVDTTVDVLPPPDTVKPTGSEGGPCTGGGGCDPGLACRSKTCVRLHDATVDMPADLNVDTTVDQLVVADSAVDQSVDAPPVADLTVDTVPNPAVDATVDVTIDTTLDLPPDTVSPDATVDSAPPSFGATGIAINTESGHQSTPSGAFDGTNFLFVWQDSRTAADQIYAARVSPAGVVLDPQGFLVGSGGAEDLNEPVVAFDGTNYLVAWRDRNDWDSQIMGVRVSTAGVILDGTQIGIATGSDNQEKPAIAFGGSTYLVAWQDDSPGTHSNIYAARLNTAGAVLDPAGIAIATTASDEDQVTVAYGSSRFLVAWREDDVIRGQRIVSDGTLLDALPGIEIATSSGSAPGPSATFDGSAYHIAWNKTGTNIGYVTRVATNGTVMDVNGFAIDSNTSSSASYTSACVVSTCFGAWYDARSGSVDIYGARYTTGATVLDTAGVAVNVATGTQTNPFTLTDGVNFFVVWQTDTAGNKDIYFNRISP